MVHQREQILHFQCQNCGGTIKWSIAKQRLECAACRSPFTPDNPDAPVLEHNFAAYAALEQEDLSFPEQTVITCSSCGAQIVFGQQDTASTCPMCGSSQVMANRQIAGVPPDGLIPFRIDKETAQQQFHKWVSSLSFAPNQLKRSYQLEKLVPVYLPFWTFDAQADAWYTGKGGRDYYDDEDNLQTDWTTVDGSMTVAYDDLAICAATGPVQELIDGILPYSTQRSAVPYDSAYLSGFSAQRYAVRADTALGQAKEKIRRHLIDRAEKLIKEDGYDHAEVNTLDFNLSHVGYKHILLPAWVSTFTFDGKQYLYLINGETGKVTGKRPFSLPKILAACLVSLIIVIWFILLMIN